MKTYLALLRGINVGGNSLIRMSELKASLTAAKFDGVQTYIQSGNIIFKSRINETNKLAQLIKTTIYEQFNLNVGVVVFSSVEWQSIIDAAPPWWGKDKDWKHNLLIMITNPDMADIVQAIGTLKPSIEILQAGNRVIYQAISLKMFGRTTSGKLATKPIYKQMTIRNYNTATKLAILLA